MKNKVEYNGNIHETIFEKVEIPFKTSKDDVWDILDAKIQDQPSILNVKNFKLISFVKYAVAAMVVALIGLTSFLRFHTVDIECSAGSRLSHVLPDGSVVDLNAASTLSYSPYWWNFNREVSFEGEAFFSIEKGERFLIKSSQGTTEILGTSFNIFARDNDYKVFCKTGKIRVTGNNSEFEFVITPGDMAIINTISKAGVVKQVTADKILAWQADSFNFASETLAHVFKALERQYDVSIALDDSKIKSLVYTGYFKKGSSVETSLEYICKSFNLQYKKDKKGRYKIYSRK